MKELEGQISDSFPQAQHVPISYMTHITQVCIMVNPGVSCIIVNIKPWRLPAAMPATGLHGIGQAAKQLLLSPDLTVTVNGPG